jgi:hypothetical protein
MTGHPLPPKLTGTDQVGLHVAELIDDDLGLSIGKGPDSRVAGLSSKPRQRRTVASRLQLHIVGSEGALMV